MQKLDYVLLVVTYLLALVATGVTGNVHVSNPVTSDYLTAGLGSLLGSYFIVSVITLPLQFFSGWNKFGYIRKTLIGSTIHQLLLILLNLF